MPWQGGLAAALARNGVKAGDRVALMSSNRPEWVVAVQAIWRLGAAVVLFSPAWKQAETEHALAITNPEHAVGDHPVLANLMPMLHLDGQITARGGIAQCYRQSAADAPSPVRLLPPPACEQPSAWHTELASRIDPAAEPRATLPAATAREAAQRHRLQAATVAARELTRASLARAAH